MISGNNLVGDGTATIFLAAQTGSISNVTVTGNWIDGAPGNGPQYLIYGIGPDSFTGLSITNNHIGSNYANSSPTDITVSLSQSGNLWLSSGLPISF